MVDCSYRAATLRKILWKYSMQNIIREHSVVHVRCTYVRLKFRKITVHSIIVFFYLFHIFVVF